MDDETVGSDEFGGEASSAHPWWRRWGIAALAAVVVALVATAVVIGNQESTDDEPVAGPTAPATSDATPPDQTSNATPDETPSASKAATDAPEPQEGGGGEDTKTSPPGESSMDPQEAVREARRAVEDLLAASDAAYQDPNGELEGLSAIASGAAYSEVQAAVAELSDARWRQAGTVEVADVSVGDVDVTSSPEKVELAVCLDTTDVDIVDRAGASVRGPADVGPTRTLHEYRAEYIDGSWMIVDHGLPDDADC